MGSEGSWVKGGGATFGGRLRVCTSGDGWRSGSEGLTHTRLVQGTVALPQGEGG